MDDVTLEAIEEAEIEVVAPAVVGVNPMKPSGPIDVDRSDVEDSCVSKVVDGTLGTSTVMPLGSIEATTVTKAEDTAAEAVLSVSLEEERDAGEVVAVETMEEADKEDVLPEYGDADDDAAVEDATLPVPPALRLRCRC